MFNLSLSSSAHYNPTWSVLDTTRSIRVELHVVAMLFLGLISRVRMYRTLESRAPYLM